MIMKTFSQFTETIKHQAGSETTPTASTISSYKKAARLLQPMLSKHATVLDYGSGFGVGHIAMQSVLGTDITIESYEPHAERAKYQPTYYSSSEVTGPYDAVVCLNVVNVLIPELREQVVAHIGHVLANGGHAIISSRSWNGDIEKIKNIETGDEPRSVWVLKKTKTGTTRVYQKGFDGNELAEYVRGILGGEFSVQKLTGHKAISSNAVIVTKSKSQRSSSEKPTKKHE